MHLQEVSLRSSEASMQCSTGYGVVDIFNFYMLGYFFTIVLYYCDGSDFIYW